MLENSPFFVSFAASISDSFFTQVVDWTRNRKLMSGKKDKLYEINKYIIELNVNPSNI